MTDCRLIFTLIYLLKDFFLKIAIFNYFRNEFINNDKFVWCSNIKITSQIPYSNNT